MPVEWAGHIQVRVVFQFDCMRQSNKPVNEKPKWFIHVKVQYLHFSNRDVREHIIPKHKPRTSIPITIHKACNYIYDWAETMLFQSTVASTKWLTNRARRISSKPSTKTEPGEMEGFIHSRVKLNAKQWTITWAAHPNGFILLLSPRFAWPSITDVIPSRAHPLSVIFVYTIYNISHGFIAEYTFNCFFHSSSSIWFFITVPSMRGQWGNFRLISTGIHDGIHRRSGNRKK